MGKKVWEMVRKTKPFLGVTLLQIGYAGMNIITAVSLKHGMNHFILSFYRHLFASIFIVPFAFFFERTRRPKMTLSVFVKITLLSFLEPVLDQNLSYIGLQYTSVTFAAACYNALPAFTFILATILRIEKLNIRKLPSQAKILGTVVTVSGAMVMTLYRGPTVDIFGAHFHGSHTPVSLTSTSRQWVIGAVCLLIGCFSLSVFFVLQAFTLKEYPAELSLSAWICFMGAVEGGVVSLVAVREFNEWKLGLDSKLLASLYTGILCTGIAYYVLASINRERGPVFVTVFSPFWVVFTAIFGFIFLHELLHLGSIIGTVIIIIGLYTVIWGKSKDQAISKTSPTTTTTTTTTTSETDKTMELPTINDFSTALAMATTTTTTAAATITAAAATATATSANDLDAYTETDGSTNF